jgi:hypothetical protein
MLYFVELALLILGLWVVLASVEAGRREMGAMVGTLHTLIYELRRELKIELREELGERVKRIRELCTPLAFMGVSDSDSAPDHMMWKVLNDVEEAAKKHGSFQEAANWQEEQELREFERDHGAEMDFSPSDKLKELMIGASVARAFRKIAYENFRVMRRVFVSALNERISIAEAEEIANDKLKKLNLGTLSIGDGFDVLVPFDAQDPKIKREIDSTFRRCEERWKNGKWKDTLSRCRKTERCAFGR